ncbi:hypothetical protein J2X20_002126 [Pelomonas saccharophila]|uniref:Uncharacterized protein n=1 Tax=Roseateles saccharophilus TaxID=304 RepID=A0ABU1YKW4_ROSSA|nr:hypothetical protein [Roseateles saccharophilus]MDR7269497.1 hypothetical protein [Roseateles saccharophilus]
MAGDLIGITVDTFDALHERIKPAREVVLVAGLAVPKERLGGVAADGMTAEPVMPAAEAVERLARQPLQQRDARLQPSGRAAHGQTVPKRGPAAKPHGAPETSEEVSRQAGGALFNLSEWAL